jgi:cold shock CspA family protein
MRVLYFNFISAIAQAVLKVYQIICYQSKSTVMGATSHLFPSLTSPSGNAPISALPTKELTMKYFGTVKSFDNIKGYGEIKPETGAEALGFETSAISWNKNISPTVGQRLSYELGTNKDRQPCALNLQTI